MEPISWETIKPDRRTKNVKELPNCGGQHKNGLFRISFAIDGS